MVCVFLEAITSHVSFLPWTKVGKRESATNDRPFASPCINIQISDNHTNKWIYVNIVHVDVCFSGTLHLLGMLTSSSLKFSPGKVLHDHVFPRMSLNHSQILWIPSPLEFLSLLNNFQFNYRLSCIVYRCFIYIYLSHLDKLLNDKWCKGLDFF